MIKIVAYYTVFVIDYYSVWVLFVHLKFIGFYYQSETCANFKPEQDWFVDLRILQVMDSPLNMWVNLFSVLKKYQKSWFIIGRPSGKRNERTQNEVWEKMKQIKNKAISMMRGKSPPSELNLEIIKSKIEITSLLSKYYFFKFLYIIFF